MVPIAFLRFMSIVCFFPHSSQSASAIAASGMLTFHLTMPMFLQEEVYKAEVAAASVSARLMEKEQKLTLLDAQSHKLLTKSLQSLCVRFG